MIALAVELTAGPSTVFKVWASKDVVGSMEANAPAPVSVAALEIKALLFIVISILLYKSLKSFVQANYNGSHFE
jgi:hypothetical protein